MGVNQYLVFGGGVGANVLDPTDYTALAARTSGFLAGLARSEEANTPWRQASVAAAGVAQFVVDTTPAVDMLDDGDAAAFKLKLNNALLKLIGDQIAASGAFGSGGIFGLTLSNTASFTTTRVTMAIGSCRDSTNTSNMVLAGAITKRLDQAWAVGTGNGGRDTGALANGQTWHVFLIYNPTTTVTDALFSQSASAPTLPAGFTKFRRVGAIMLEAASTAIRQFLQTDDWFMLKTRSADFANTANGAGPYLRQITVPLGISVEAKIYFQTQSVGGPVGGANPSLSGVYWPDFGTPTAFGGPTQWAQFRSSDATTGGRYMTGVIEQFTDTAQHVYTNSNDPNDVIAMGVLGWRDTRGRFLNQ